MALTFSPVALAAAADAGGYVLSGNGNRLLDATRTVDLSQVCLLSNIPCPVISSPANNTEARANLRESRSGRVYASVPVTGYALDLDDGHERTHHLAWYRLRWWVSTNGGTSVLHAGGESATLRLYHDCVGSPVDRHVIILEAWDFHDNVRYKRATVTTTSGIC